MALPAGTGAAARVRPRPRRVPRACAEEPLLLRAARGQRVERPPAWCYRQAGRYHAEFRKYSDVLPFRERSETPDIAFELSLQPWRAYDTDAVIMFSDILTPLPAVGVDFDIVKGKGPVIANPVRTVADAERLAAAPFNPETDLPFVAEVLERLREELKGKDTTLIGFVGAPFTLAAYAIEGMGVKNLVETKRFMYGNDADTPEAVLTNTLEKLTTLVGEYIVFQIDHGAQVVQLFDSWAHHLSPDQYCKYALPYVRKAAAYAKTRRPDTPLMFFANGSGGKLEDIKAELSDVIDVFAIDWSVRMSAGRARLGDDTVLQGNIDPSILVTGDENAIRDAVRTTIEQAAGGGLILNLGHGVIKESPEESVGIFFDAVKQYSYPKSTIPVEAK